MLSPESWLPWKSLQVSLTAVTSLSGSLMEYLPSQAGRFLSFRVESWMLSPESGVRNTSLPYQGKQRP